MTGGLLMDTCALIWIGALAGETHLGPAEDAMNEARAKGQPICISPISAWEIGLLVAKGRIPMSMSPKTWLDAAIGSKGLIWSEMPVDVLLASATLPGEIHADPADRIIIATAREYGMRLVTRDRRILDYAAKGHLLALAC